jgi:uncharacterized LabA/DUF88 family protein
VAASAPMAPYQPSEDFNHILLIDGAYLQIGIRDLNKSFETNFRLEKESKLKKFFETLQILLGHPLDKILFVSADDYDGMIKNEVFYLRLQKIGVEIDMREYKKKSFNCSKCKQTNSQKVQAEVDVAIAVKLIHFAQMPNVKTISLFAGDRDFYDAIEYVQETY